MAEMENVGIDPTFLRDFFQEVADKKFPLNNISFLLWLEVVKWYKQDNTSSMRYLEETKKFWKLGWRHFGGKFIRFMSGFKNISQLSSGITERGFFSPDESEINFAVPSMETLSKFLPYGTVDSYRNPGTFLDIISGVSKALRGASACVSFDGKKLKQGLTETSGDVDLLGFEEGKTLCDRQAELKLRLGYLDQIENEIRMYESLTDFRNLSDSIKFDSRTRLLSVLRCISFDMQNIRAIQAKKEYALEKFIERSGKEWRNAKFAYVISSIKAFLYDIELYRKLFCSVIEEICCVVAYINECDFSYCRSNVLDLNKQKNYLDIRKNYSDNDSRKVKQRSPDWYKVREGAVVTGSTIYQAVGLETLKKQKEYFDTVVCKEKVTEKPANIQEAMRYGTENEINATATFAGKVLPVLDPNLKLQEEGYLKKILTSTGHCMVISPDGSLINDENRTVSAVEFKCPVAKLQTELPHRYYLQCQATMYALGVSSMYYLCWRPDISSVFQVNRDDKTFIEAMGIITSLFCVDKRKRPSKLHSAIPSLRENIEKGRKNALFMGEFPSVSHKVMDSTPQPSNMTLEVKNVIDLCQRLKTTIKEGYHLQREKATEAVVFLCSDLDRSYDKNPLRWAPINWFPKGYSLSTDIMREMMENVLNECYKRGLHVPAVSFDGQWHLISTYSLNRRPLTLLQLQKSTWKEVEKMQKSVIVKDIASLNKDKPSFLLQKGFICSNTGKILPKTPVQGWKKIKQSLTMDSTNTSNQEGVTETFSENTLMSNEDLHLTAESVVSDQETLQKEESQNSTDKLEIIEEYVESDLVAAVSHESSLSLPSNFVSLKLCSESAILLAFLRTDPMANKKGKWDQKNEDDIRDILSTYSKLENLLNADLKILVRFVKSRMKDVDLKESYTKAKKLEKLAELLNLNQNEVVDRSTYHSRESKAPKRLSELAKNVLQSPKVPKSVLNIAYATYIWFQKLETWKSESPISDEVHVGDLMEPKYWFSIPEYSQNRQQLEVKSVDATHLFTRLRRHSCKGKIDRISSDAWLKVASQGNTLLTKIMVEEVVDPMSASMARTHFSEAVENEIRKNGDDKSADLCQDIRKWWMANDDPGIPAVERVQMRMPLRHRLMKGIDFKSPKFPPPSMYINGFPIQLWEALLIDIDSKSQLYALCHSGSYNVRAFSSMMGETFFSELTLQDSRGHGAVTCEDFSRFIGKAIEQMEARLDKTRCFSYRTSRKTVYKMVGKTDSYSVEDPHILNDLSMKKTIIEIHPRDHYFDNHDRIKSKYSQKKKENTISTQRTAVLKGTLGVRWEKARIDQSKILPTKRMGISDNEERQTKNS